MASRLGGQSEEHDGAVLAQRLESLEAMVRDLKTEEEEQMATIRQLREVSYQHKQLELREWNVSLSRVNEEYFAPRPWLVVMITTTRED